MSFSSSSSPPPSHGQSADLSGLYQRPPPAAGHIKAEGEEDSASISAAAAAAMHTAIKKHTIDAILGLPRLEGSGRGGGGGLEGGGGGLDGRGLEGRGGGLDGGRVMATNSLRDRDMDGKLLKLNKFFKGIISGAHHWYIKV
jgi:hypothetical protein